MLTTTSKILGAAKTSVLRRVTTTSLLHSGFLISNCTMRPPTFPVAPSTTTEYCIRPRLHSVMIAHRRIYIPGSNQFRREENIAMCTDDTQPVATELRGLGQSTQQGNIPATLGDP